MDQNARASQEAALSLTSDNALTGTGPAGAPIAAKTSPSTRLRIRKATVPGDQGQNLEVFVLALEDESIELLPLRNWGQLDVYKWRVRGKLPGTPAGLEITHDHVKLSGEIVYLKDSDGCARLEHLFNEWLALELSTQEMARKKTTAKALPSSAVSTAPGAPQPLRFQVEMDKEQQVHVRCARGKQVEALIGLNQAGFQSLVTQGFMRKPRSLKTGALHNWVEIDGVLFSFEKGRDDSVLLEQALNKNYLPASDLGQGKDILALANSASSTGFDLQFGLTSGGVTESRKRHLNEETLELLQDSERCGLLQKGIVIKLARPTLIFKRKTQDGGERYLEKIPENIVLVTGTDGQEKRIDLSQPVNYMHLDPTELTAILNHPVINRHGKLAAALPSAGEVTTATAPSPPSVTNTAPIPADDAIKELQRQLQELVDPADAASPPTIVSTLLGIAPGQATAEASVADRRMPSAGSMTLAETPALQPALSVAPVPPVNAPAPPPPVIPAANAWLEPILAHPPMRHDYVAFLIYNTLAHHFGNSREGRLGLSACWAIALSETKHPEEPLFRGLFLTEKGGLGFIDQGRMARFNKGVAFLGTQEAALEGIGVRLLAVAIDSEERLFFIVNDGFRSKFGAPDATVAQELKRLASSGVIVLSAKEAVQSADPIELVWTVPEAQVDPADPQVVESRRPADIADEPTDAG